MRLRTKLIYSSICSLLVALVSIVTAGKLISKYYEDAAALIGAAIMVGVLCLAVSVITGIAAIFVRK